jgi:hypothetical protein
MDPLSMQYTSGEEGMPQNFVRQARLSRFRNMGGVASALGASSDASGKPWFNQRISAEAAYMAVSALGVSPLLVGSVYGAAAGSQSVAGKIPNARLLFLDFNLVACLGNVQRQTLNWLSSLTPLLMEVN